MGYWAKDGSYVYDKYDIETFEEMNKQKREADQPYKEYFKKLVENPIIHDEKEYEEAVIHSMQSDEVSEGFINGLVDKISGKAYEMKNLGKGDEEKIQILQEQIEQLVNLYEKYLYKLKENNRNFRKTYNGMSERIDYKYIIPEETLELLWSLQKKFNITFKMLIPADLGYEYGKKFERNGFLIPGVRLMYDDLIGKDVYWHDVVIYNKNELTPYERFKERQKKKLEEFENARKEAIADTLTEASTKSSPKGK